jgi:hypothetical protein
MEQKEPHISNINPDLDKNRDLLIKLLFQFYENQIKQSESTNNVFGFIIAANGVILLAFINIIQMIFSNNILIAKDSLPILLVLIANLAFTFLSIWTSISYILISQPITFSIPKVPLELINQKYIELQVDIFNSLNTIIEKNHQIHQKAQYLFFISYATFGLSIFFLVVEVGLYMVAKTK